MCKRPDCSSAHVESPALWAGFWHLKFVQGPEWIRNKYPGIPKTMFLRQSLLEKHFVLMTPNNETRSTIPLLVLEAFGICRFGSPMTSSNSVTGVLGFGPASVTTCSTSGLSPPWRLEMLREKSIRSHPKPSNETHLNKKLKEANKKHKERV